jgi:transposase
MSGSHAQTPGCGVIDNVPFHKASSVQKAIEAGGATLRYLPPSSPDFNPIEMVLHPLKTFLRKAAERTIEGLQRCVQSYIRALDPSECMGYFRHAGYEPS